MAVSLHQWTFPLQQQKGDPSHCRSYGHHLKSQLSAVSQLRQVLQSLCLLAISNTWKHSAHFQLKTLFINFYGKKKYNKWFIAQRLGLQYKVLCKYTFISFNIQWWSNYVCEPSPELRWGSSIKISGAVPRSWELPYIPLNWSLRHNTAKTGRQHTCYLCDEPASRKLTLSPSNFPYKLNFQTIFFHLYNI